MKKLLLLLAIIFGLNSVCNAQLFEWARLESFGTSNIATDGQHLFVTAPFTDTLTFGNTTLIGSNSPSRYLVKYNQTDSVIWAKNLIGMLGIANNDLKIITDSDQNIVLAGLYSDSLYYDSLIFKNPQQAPGVNRIRTNVFIIKLNAAGELLWAKNSDTISKINPIGLGTDSIGNIYIGGYFGNAITFNNTTVNAAGTADMFLLKYDKLGNLQWLKSGLTSPDYIGAIGKGMAVSPGGEVHLVYNTRTPSSYWTPPIHLKKLNNAGILQWHQTVPFFHLSNFSLDNSGNIYLFGVSDSTAAIGNLPIPSNRWGSQNSIFMAKLNPAGTWKWVKKIIPGNYWGSVNSIGNLVNNAFSISGTFTGTATIGNRSFNSGFPAYERYITKVDTSGIAYNGITIKGTTNNTVSDYRTFTVTNSNGNTYLSSAFGAFGPYTIGNLLIGPYVLAPKSSGATLIIGTGYLVKVQDNTNQILGSVFIDDNANGIQDSLEIPVENSLIEITPGPVFISSNADGTFSAPVPSGSFNLNLVQPIAHYTLSPPTQTVSFSGLSQTQTRNFALIPIPNRNDVKVTITNLTPARPGFPLKYRITYQNVGTTTVSDTISLNYDANHLTFTSTTATPVLQQNGKIKWFYQPLQPTELRNIDIEFTIASTSPLSTNLEAYVYIKPLVIDLNQANNYDTLSINITGAYDPNDKQVNHGALSPAQVTNGEFLDYTIRFQNTGTDTAFTVIIRDAITSKLFIPSMELLSASHNYTFKLLENNVAEWRFDNILLPDSNTNEPASHGFVRFRIKPQNYLQLGDSITNSAAIYFDFNAPIITNTAVTRISQPLGLKEEKAGLTALYLYPNPATEILTVEAELKKPQATTVILRNVLGQEVYRQSLGNLQQVNHKIDIRNLPKGVYLLQLQTGANQVSRRVVVQ